MKIWLTTPNTSPMSLVGCWILSSEGNYLDFEDYWSIVEIRLYTEVWFLNEEKGRGWLKKCSDQKVSHFVGTQTWLKEDDCGIFFSFGEGRLWRLLISIIFTKIIRVLFISIISMKIIIRLLISMIFTRIIAGRKNKKKNKVVYSQ